MSLDEIETRYCQFVDEVIIHQRLDRLAAYLTEDVIEHAPRVPPGLVGARQVVASYFTAFPDFHLAIEALLAVDDQLLARLSATGTHGGQFMGIVATGKRVAVSAFGAWRLRDGQCAEHWLQLDLLSLLQQLGAEAAVQREPAAWSV